MGQRKVRILMAKFGQGYEAALMRLAAAFSEAGFEVIYTESEDPKAIVNAALQESVDHIGITTLPEARLDQFAAVLELLKAHDAQNIGVTAGGFFDDALDSGTQEIGRCGVFPEGNHPRAAHPMGSPKHPPD